MVHSKQDSGEEDITKDGSKFRFVTENDLVCRTCVASPCKEKIGKNTLVVPFECRKIILNCAHEGPPAGHFSRRKAEMRIKEHFH